MLTKETSVPSLGFAVFRDNEYGAIRRTHGQDGAGQGIDDADPPAQE